jgi:hypothetical protein
MHRWTGRCLLLLALMGIFVPVALAVSAPAVSHACCVHQVAPVHPCHGMVMASPQEPSEQLTLHGNGCCGNDCRRASTTARWAQPQAQAFTFVRRVVVQKVALPQSVVPSEQHASFQSTRAPPSC